MRAHRVTIDVHGNYQILQKLALGDAAVLVRKSNMSVPEPILKSWFWQLACAVACLHSHGILHQDIKGANILLYGLSVLESQAKLGDYSLSTLILDEKGTHDIGSSYGYTPTHRAPEIWERKSYSYKADVWALGCAFYEIMYNQLLFTDQRGYPDEKASYLKSINSWVDFCNDLVPSMMPIIDHKPPVILSLIHI